MNKKEENFNLNLSNNFAIPQILDKKYEVFSAQIRLSIMLILNSYHKTKITHIQQAFKISSGKLEHHLMILENEGLISKKSSIFPHRIQLVIEITQEGKKRLQSYIELMKDIFNQIDSSKNA